MILKNVSQVKRIIRNAMKCYLSKGKYLVPYCWPVINSGDISDCTCVENPHLEHIKWLKSQGKEDDAIEYRKVMKEQSKYR